MDASQLQLQQAVFQDRVASSRRMDPVAKIIAGASLFDVARRRMLVGIRSRHPDWSDAEVEAEFHRQMTILRALSERGVYTPCGSL